MKTILKMSIVLLAAVMLTSCGTESKKMNSKLPKSYVVKRAVAPVTIDANWDKPVWRDVKPVKLTLYMGEKPEHIPGVQAKVAYDDANIYVIFRVDDNYIKAVAQKNQDPVCRDSCVEFFFTPGVDISLGYMNMETNCCGKMLLYYQKSRGVGIVEVADVDLATIEIAHSLPYSTITEEIQTPTVWTLEYRMPLSLIEKYMPSASKPAKGVVWKANFYKCADKTSKPHWLTWSFVDMPQPDFHRPNYFGSLVFE